MPEPSDALRLYATVVTDPISRQVTRVSVGEDGSTDELPLGGSVWALPPYVGDPVEGEVIADDDEDPHICADPGRQAAHHAALRRIEAHLILAGYETAATIKMRGRHYVLVEDAVPDRLIIDDRGEKGY
ncbi:hypothetical protein [Streptomyces sp. 7N604]|uniref:hypothetical protein n=1 Tax=Streptomyces sp. 7N604 TaxID=3457415 RepID=UPI003FD4D786